MAILKIQEKLRRILGNTVKVARTLASGKLPTLRDTVEAFMEASGVAFKCRYIADASGNFVPVAASAHNPLGFTLGNASGVNGLYGFTLSNPSSQETYDIDRLAFRAVFETDDGFGPYPYFASCYIGSVDNAGASRGVVAGFRISSGANAAEGTKIIVTLERW